LIYSTQFFSPNSGQSIDHPGNATATVPYAVRCPHLDAAPVNTCLILFIGYISEKLSSYFTHLPRSPPWSDLHKIGVGGR